MAGKRPRGLLKWLFRVPVWVYRLRLGFLFGTRFLMIEHRGRTSGRRYRTVVEVVSGPNAAGEWYVVAGFGPRTDWYRNLEAGGLEAIWVGSRRHEATARFLAPEEAAGIMEVYENENPKAAAFLHRTFGIGHDGTDEGRIDLMGRVPMVGLTAGG